MNLASFPDAFTGLMACLSLLSPAILLAVTGLASLSGLRLHETLTNRLTAWSTAIGLAAIVYVTGSFILQGHQTATLELGNWITLREQHFHFRFKFIFDALSLAFAVASYILCGLVSVFSSRYLHRDRGYGRFFMCYAIFTFGMILSALAATIEVLFVGWELVGLSSAMLVAFFHERPSPVKNGLRIWCIYRISDAAFLVGALYLHHLTGEGDLQNITGIHGGNWPDGVASITPGQALLVGILFLVAAAGKSGLIPFSGWLPRAMEGPTPSSAIFYGALSVHLGAYLFLRICPILAVNSVLPWLLVVAGLATAFMAALSSRVQTDIKSALAFSSLTQVGIIFTEIGLGLRWIALVHLIGHTFLRTLQLLRAPNLLHDYRTIENAIGGRLDQADGSWNQRLIPDGVRKALYRLAIERSFLDQALDQFIVRPFVGFFRFCERIENSMADWINGNHRPRT